MKRRTNIILVAILVMIGAILWVAVRGQKEINATAEAPAGASAVRRLSIRVRPLPPVIQSPAETGQADTSGPNKTAGTRPGYTAVEGDTLTDVVAGLRGKDTKENRDAVTAANPSLQDDPDRVLAGKTYLLTAPGVGPVAAPSSEDRGVSLPATRPGASVVARPDSERVLKYTARPGDSVSVLAAGLLGGNSETTRDAIISENYSLQHDPDRLVAGKTYNIPAGNGLSAAPGPVAAYPPLPASPPDADEVVRRGAGRELRYTARTGDTVSRLAEVLLGSDTRENRDAIINNNVSLKSDPDRVVAGQTYWIPAPAAPVEQP